MIVRFMYHFDVNKALEIDHAVNGRYSWTKADYRSLLIDRNGCGIVALNGVDRIVGFCVYDLDIPDAFHIVNMGVENERQGIGRLLIDKMKSKLNRRNRLICMVEEARMSAHLFFKAMGFKSQLVRKREGDLVNFYFEKNDECTS